jgi:hypothetical protein
VAGRVLERARGFGLAIDRGLCGSLGLAPEDFADHGPELVAELPICSLVLHRGQSADAIERLAAWAT